VSLQNVKKYLGEFKGTERRLQYLGKYKGAMIIDDYAHHPTEIKATLRGVRGHYSAKNIITVFHPHTFTRTKALFNDFVKSFENTDELIVLDIYGSAREKQGGTSSKLLVQAISAYNSRNKINQNILNIKSIKEVSQYLKKKLTKNDLVLLMGAGDVFRVYDNL
jgi:UDP-N-acetylmuramate--alanine ligase